MNRAALSGPSPKTTCVLEWQSPHFVQPSASFWASANSKRLILLGLGEDETKQQVDHESQQGARTWNYHGDYYRHEPYHVGAPPVGVGHAPADAPDPTVPLRPLDIQNPTSSGPAKLSARFYTTSVGVFYKGMWIGESARHLTRTTGLEQPLV